MTPLLLAALLLQPVLAEDGPLRLVAVGTGEEAVTWTLDGVEVARTADGQAVSVPASAGPHELWASSPAKGEWRALARPEGTSAAGAMAVPAWTAVHPAEPEPAWPPWALPAGLSLLAAAVLVRPQSLLQALRRRRQA